jgi:hypothetical protein
MFAYTALPEGLLLLYPRPRFPVPVGGEVVEPPYEKAVRRFGPPHVSALLPLQAMLQPALPSEAGPPPLVNELPHPVCGLVDDQHHGLGRMKFNKMVKTYSILQHTLSQRG